VDSSEIFINGKSQAFIPDSTIDSLLASRGIDPAQVVVEINGAIVKRESFGSHAIHSGDTIEIVRFVGGG
jgi:thiamine biosynthesis protein ThiS